MLKADFHDTFIDEPLDEYVIMTRDAEGNLSTNVPHIVLHHSTNGYEWGNRGAGAGDLSLNIIENLLRQTGYEGRTMIDIWTKNTVFIKSWELHEEFKRMVVARMPRVGGQLYVNELIVWIQERCD